MSKLRDWMRRQIGVNPAKVTAEIGKERGDLLNPNNLGKWLAEGFCEGIRRKEFDNMTKQNQIHVLADESVGGIMREYVEVAREANPGDLVQVRKVRERESSEAVYVSTLSGEPFGVYTDDFYVVLEPIDIVHIGGERFRLVDRKAEVGERVIVIKESFDDENNIGRIFAVLTIESDIDGDQLAYVDGKWNDGSAMNLHSDEYNVLVPDESEKSETSPQSTDDIIANLARRVSSLERKNTELERQNNAMLDVYERDQKWTHERINGVKADIETWAQEHEEFANDYDKLTYRFVETEEDVRKLKDATKPKQITIDAEVLARLIGGAID